MTVFYEYAQAMITNFIKHKFTRYVYNGYGPPHVLTWLHKMSSLGFLVEYNLSIFI